jgi:L-threonine-O-3-phosphate decarboxylase
LTRPKHGGNLLWAATIARCPVSSILDFSASINPLGPPQSAITAIQSSISQLPFYPDSEYTRLTSVLAQHHHLDVEYILPGNGSAELLTWAGRELAQQKFTYLMTPAFSDYGRALRAFRGKIRFFNLLESDNLALPPINSNCRQYGLIINNPHNPTGKLWTKDEIIPYLQQFSLVLVDEAFMDFLPPEEEQSLISLVLDYPNLVILRSLTKFYSLPGLRIGYAIAHPDRLQRWKEWRDPWSVNILAAEAAIAAIADRDFQQQTWNWLYPTKDKLFNDLKQIAGLSPLPSAANFLLVKANRSTTELQRELLIKNHILIRDCLSFPELGDLYFRIAVRTLEDNNRLFHAIDLNL